MRLFLTTLFAAGVALYFVYPYHFGLPYFDTDFVDYCVGVSTYGDGDRHFPPKRSRAAGLLPFVLSTRFGVLNGLAWASTIAMIAVGALLVQWSHLIKRGSGWTTLAVLLACSPWIGTGRYLTFYPMILLLLTLGTFLVWTVYQKKFQLHLTAQGGLLGLGIGLCMLADARGVVWGGWLLLVTVIWIFTVKSIQKILALVLGLTSTLWATWLCGSAVYGPHSTSFIRQIDVRPLRYALSLSDATPPPYSVPTEFVWGWEANGLIEGFLFVIKQQTLALPTTAPSNYWVLWLSIVSISLILTVRKYWTFWLVLIPFILAFLQIGHSVENHVRFYIQSLPPLMIGVGLALAQGVQKLQQQHRIWARLILFIVLPYCSILFSHHWTLEREISHKMLTQAHPENLSLQDQPVIFGTPIHIQTLPVTATERRITQDWDKVCTEALTASAPTVWFEPIK